jgi:hypothetical protein
LADYVVGIPKGAGHLGKVGLLFSTRPQPMPSLGQWEWGEGGGQAVFSALWVEKKVYF